MGKRTDRHCQHQPTKKTIRQNIANKNANYSLWYKLYTKISFVNTLVSNDFKTQHTKYFWRER